MIETLSLFSGCGGLDLGIEGGFKVHKKALNPKAKNGWTIAPKTPFKVVWANDIMPQAQKAWQANFEGNYVLESIETLLEQGYSFPKVDLVIGGFPCQDFSLAGKRKGFLSSRGQLYKAMAKVLKQVQPKAFIAENVYGLLSIEGALEEITQTFSASGYNVYTAPLFAQDYGIPQTRQRIFFIGIREDIQPPSDEASWYFPESTHRVPLSLAETFFDLKEPENTTNIEQKHYSKAKWYGKGRQGNIEVNLANPGPTMRAEHHGNIEFRRLAKEHGGQYHHELEAGLKERRLTVRECARIQTFPDDFALMQNTEGDPLLSASSAYKVLGNAVPPLLAYRVASHLASKWDLLT
jgi:DNA (cytosine-5)-methyltransferase 1